MNDDVLVTGTIRFSRGLSPMFRRLRILVDGELLARLKPLGEFSVQMPPGVYECKAGLDGSSGSPTVEVVVRPGQVASVRFMRNREGDLWENAMAVDRFIRVEVG